MEDGLVGVFLWVVAIDDQGDIASALDPIQHPSELFMRIQTIQTLEVDLTSGHFHH